MLLIVESFDSRPSSQCILVSVIPSFFRSANMFAPNKSLIEAFATIKELLDF
jgi:hypothetical protein